jgi:hypothetical protein
MSDPLLIALICLQIFFGAADTLLHHEFTERLAWRPSQRRELALHGVRNFFYAGIFLLIGFSEPKGLAAVGLIAALAFEIAITLWDFVEEDRSRKLPATERVLHTLLALNYGAILALMSPLLLRWAGEPTALLPADNGVFAWICAAAAAATALFGARDLAASMRARRLQAAAPARLAFGLKARSRILVTGATGFVGKRLVEALTAAGHDVTALTRDRARADALPAPIRIVTSLDQIGNETPLDAIVHLAGEPVSNGLWTEKKRQRIVESRTTLTADLIELVARLKERPHVFVAASAVGWYGVREDGPLSETDAAAGESFSAASCAAVEDAARGMEIHGVRTVRLRIGLVLGHQGGMLAKLLTPFEFGLGGPIGHGRQTMSWIALDDLVRLIVYAIRRPSLNGPLNAVAPGAVDNKSFVRELGRALGRPAIIPVPGWPLSKAFGAFADELLLGGQHVVPAKAVDDGFIFETPSLAEALAQCVGGTGRRAMDRPVLHSRTASAQVP